MDKPITEIGILGVNSPATEALIAALQKQSRLRVTHVYDTCFPTAKTLAATLHAQATPSLQKFFDSRRIRGVIVLETGWQRSQPLFLACCCQMPVLFEWQPQLDSPYMTDHLFSLSRDNGTLMMPSLMHRWQPVTLRLKELLATKLGKVTHIAIQLHGRLRGLAPALDWCGDLLQSLPANISGTPRSGFELQYQRKNGSESHVAAQLKWTPGEERPLFPWTAEITCEQGHVRVTSEHQLQWQLHGNPEAAETLITERMAWEVMLDLFGRRLAGGLIPVPSLEDLQRCRTWLERCLKESDEEI